MRVQLPLAQEIRLLGRDVLLRELPAPSRWWPPVFVPQTSAAGRFRSPTAATSCPRPPRAHAVRRPALSSWRPSSCAARNRCSSARISRSHSHSVVSQAPKSARRPSVSPVTLGVGSQNVGTLS
jgi:hypothetical protein